MSASSFICTVIGAIIGQFLARWFIDFFERKDSCDDEAADEEEQ